MAPRNKKQDAAAAAAAGNGIPEGMTLLGGSYADGWNPDNEGDFLHGRTSGTVRTVQVETGPRNKRETVDRRVVEITDMDGNRHGLWESAALGPLFDELESRGPDGIGTEVYVRFDGLGKKKPGQNAPKKFTTAIAA